MASLRTGFVPVVGIEVHAQMATTRKLFSPARHSFAAAPNTVVAALDRGLPGTLPRLNWDCVRAAVKTGLALGCTVHRDSRFDRKHYFYPDLPLGYQITQQYRPICTDGELQLVLRDGSQKRVRVSRLHMEQDSGKLMHDTQSSLLDLNRAGSALMEIVSAPDMRSAEEATAYVTKLARLLLFIGTCDADLSKGNLRMDVNVSVARVETIGQSLGTRCEIKNLNSLVRMRDAIEYEVDRHIDAMVRGLPLVSETRGWDTKRKVTFALRDKESVVDYRFLRDGDLPRVLLSDAEIASVRAELKETPAERVQRYCDTYGLSAYDAEAMALDPHTSRYYEAVLQRCDGGPADGQAACNWITHELMGLLNAAGIFTMENPPVTPAQLASLLNALRDTTASGKLGKRVLRVMFDGSPLDCAAIMRERGWDVLRDTAALADVAQQVLATFPAEVDAYRQGDANRRQRLMKHFMGVAMQRTKGKADPEMMRSAFESVLEAPSDVHSK